MTPLIVPRESGEARGSEKDERSRLRLLERAIYTQEGENGHRGHQQPGDAADKKVGERAITAGVPEAGGDRGPVEQEPENELRHTAPIVSQPGVSNLPKFMLDRFLGTCLSTSCRD
mgnify:CR=1 FL=1|jgi:hypothetical protein